MNPIQQILHKFPVIVLDGAMATELERYGCDLNDSLWSAKVLMEQPELIKRVHQDYFAAGADCAITASYQSTFEGFAKRGLSEAEARELIQASVKIAAEARDEFWQQEENRLNRPKPIVSASVGPYGAFLANGSEYTGQYDVTEEELMEFHRPRMKALIEAGADVLACETIPNLMEARAIARLLEEFEGAYAWITFSAKDDLHISSGTLILECARYLDSYEQVAALGVNCTPPQYISSLIKEIKSQTDKPVIVYPNSGEHYNAESKTWNGTSAGETYGCSAHSWYEAGAQLIGGCCRTTPDDIKGITKWARK
ncbi:homocysteine S-methyltransferase [Priestia megaterium]